MANGMRKLLKYTKEHPPKNVELQRINVLEAENARLRQRNEQLVEFLLSLCNSLHEWKNEEFKDKDVELHISPELIMPRDETKKSSFTGPSGAKLVWNDMKKDDALAGPEKESEAGDE